MTSIKYPLINLEMNDETARYVGLLERKLLMLTLDNLKCRTVLELLTDEPWDDQSFPDDEAELKRVATDALVRRLGVSDSEAAGIVAERWGRYNPPSAGADAAARYIVGPQMVRRPTYLTESQQTSPGYDLDKHHEGLARAAANRLADTAAPTVSESSQA
jgi:hypothetical protein